MKFEKEEPEEQDQKEPNFEKKEAKIIIDEVPFDESLTVETSGAWNQKARGAKKEVKFNKKGCDFVKVFDSGFWFTQLEKKGIWSEIADSKIIFSEKIFNITDFLGYETYAIFTGKK